MIQDKRNTLSFSIFHPSYVLRKGLKGIIESVDQNRVIGSYENVSSVKRYILQDRPDVIVIGESLLDRDKLAEIKNNPSHTRFVLLQEQGTATKYGNQYFAQQIHVHDYKEVLLKKIRELSQESGKEDEAEEKQDLSERERLVVKCIAKGLTNKEMADQLFLSPHTIITHRKNITRKLGIKTVSGLTVYALLNNIIDISEVQ